MAIVILALWHLLMYIIWKCPCATYFTPKWGRQKTKIIMLTPDYRRETGTHCAEVPQEFYTEGSTPRSSMLD